MHPLLAQLKFIMRTGMKFSQTDTYTVDCNRTTECTGRTGKPHYTEPAAIIIPNTDTAFMATHYVLLAGPDCNVSEGTGVVANKK